MIDKFLQIKITIVRNSCLNVIEVSGRIDCDEAAEDEEDSELPIKNKTPPLKKVWPYLTKVLQVFVETLDKIRTLPYYVGLFSTIKRPKKVFF